MFIRKVRERIQSFQAKKARQIVNHTAQQFLDDLPSSTMGKQLAVYLNCADLEESHVHELFDNPHAEIVTHFIDKPVFLNKESAVQYGRYQGECEAVFKLHVPEAAIVGHNETLRLKRDLLQHIDIHGCYVGWDGEENFIKNPNFQEG